MTPTHETLRRPSRPAPRAMLAAGLLALSLASQAAAQSDDLFRSPARTGVARVFRHPPDRLALRSRLVAIDLERLIAPPAPLAPAAQRTLTLNLFDDAVFTGIVEHTERTFSGGVALSGRLEGIEEGTFTLVANGAVVAGTVRTLEGVYRIRSAGDGWYSIAQIDTARLPPLGEPIRRPDHPVVARPPELNEKER